MKTIVGIAVLLLIVANAGAQPIPVTFSIDKSLDNVPISPYVFGSNAATVEAGVRITARRLGGNRMSGYNWENNASNAGIDYIHSSDDYMPWSLGIPFAKEFIPGITLTTFHDTSLAHECYTLLTLPAAGYVARDINGPVTLAETAPSPRWRQVRPFKGSPFLQSPDTSDGYVFVDEEVNFMKNKYGPASGPSGVKAYAVDNEPALWPSTHPRIHPDSTRVREMIGKIALTARAVKSVDPTADVFGGVFYGFGEYYHMQWGPDWSEYQSYENYAAALLSHLRDSSVAAGMRLLDVLDMHWYPDLNVDVGNENADASTAIHRMEAPRTLWDSSYVEDGWIGQYFHPESAALLRKTHRIIDQQYPGTRVAITEFNYGGSTHISGAVAQADVLGIFCDHGVFFASLWGDITGYIASGYRMYMNYDGNGGSSGDVSVHAASTDYDNSSVHASVLHNDPFTLHIIAINRSYDHAITGQFSITSDVQYTAAAVYALTQSSPQIQHMQGLDQIQGNQFTYELPPMSVFHFVLTVGTAVADGEHLPATWALEQNYPNPFNPTTVIRYDVPWTADVTLTVYDLLGREVATLVDGRQQPGTYAVTFDGSRLASGTYFTQLRAGNVRRTRALLLVR